MLARVAGTVGDRPGTGNRIAVVSANRIIRILRTHFVEGNYEIAGAIIIYIRRRQRSAESVTVENTVGRNLIAGYRNISGHGNIGIELRLLCVHHHNLERTSGCITTSVRSTIYNSLGCWRAGNRNSCTRSGARDLHVTDYLTVVNSHRNRPVHLATALIRIVSNHDHGRRTVHISRAGIILY